MFHAHTRDLPKRRHDHRPNAMRYALRHVLRERAAPLPYAALLMRALVLLLIILLLVFVGLMHLTGRYDVGGPVIGGILLISFIAANCAR